MSLPFTCRKYKWRTSVTNEKTNRANAVAVAVAKPEAEWHVGWPLSPSTASPATSSGCTARHLSWCNLLPTAWCPSWSIYVRLTIGDTRQTLWSTSSRHSTTRGIWLSSTGGFWGFQCTTIGGTIGNWRWKFGSTCPSTPGSARRTNLSGCSWPTGGGSRFLFNSRLVLTLKFFLMSIQFTYCFPMNGLECFRETWIPWMCKAHLKSVTGIIYL